MLIRLDQRARRALWLAAVVVGTLALLSLALGLAPWIWFLSFRRSIPACASPSAIERAYKPQLDRLVELARNPDLLRLAKAVDNPEDVKLFSSPAILMAELETLPHTYYLGRKDTH
jgi:hypothetical protein